MTWKGLRAGRLSILLLLGLVFVESAVAQQPASTLQFAPVPGGRLAYEDRGQGEPVLLIHGAIVANSPGVISPRHRTRQTTGCMQ